MHIGGDGDGGEARGGDVAMEGGEASGGSVATTGEGEASGDDVTSAVAAPKKKGRARGGKKARLGRNAYERERYK